MMLKTLWIYCDKNKIIIHNVHTLEIINEQNQNDWIWKIVQITIDER